MKQQLAFKAAALVGAASFLGLTACDTVVVHPTRTVVKKESKTYQKPRSSGSSGVYHGGSFSGGGTDSTSFQSSSN